MKNNNENLVEVTITWTVWYNSWRERYIQ